MTKDQQNQEKTSFVLLLASKDLKNSLKINKCKNTKNKKTVGRQK